MVAFRHFNKNDLITPFSTFRKNHIFFTSFLTELIKPKIDLGIIKNTCSPIDMYFHIAK